ncbi:hypothetical protein ACVTGE_07395 [Pasteurella multocida]|uniref:hypothetical protein n=1 Tax=Pasteurella multocida TaxID=747 RepID=UPI00117F731C|nr:hypothetical protein [Pasteurella multocida]MCL7794286.1 hypothetical protein [Pasteurella multocida]MCL8064653.1 hypothetical protein [Pasteurella multocida]MCO5922252.1 hypothetical protein [Pasteurella multocida]MDY0625484.1 hypothetical protein [Pasteurella multocida]MDY0653374.1 hypothetical protein [Pasteurella multocida]
MAQNATAIGGQTNVSGLGSTAVGARNTVTASNTTVLGYYITVSSNNSVYWVTTQKKVKCKMPPLLR